MTIRVLFLREGTSDNGIVGHIEIIAGRVGKAVAISNPPFDEQDVPVGNAVADKLRAAIKLGGAYDLIVVHRDADNASVGARTTEISDAVNGASPGSRFVPVIPVRMTETWLLTNEHEIRRVAGKPNGRAPLNLPPVRRLEAVANPKQMLRRALATASEATGRRLSSLEARFSQNRRQLFERLDPDGPVRNLPSWRHFVTGIENGLKEATDARR